MSRVLPDWLDSYLAYVEDSEPTKLYKTWVGVSVIASCLQRKCWSVWECQIFPNLFVILIGPSGGTRKGTAMRPGLDLLRQIGIPLSAESTTRESLIQQLGSTMTTYFDEERQEMVAHCSLTVYSQELAVFLGYNNSQLISDITDWFDCADFWSYKTKNKGEELIYNLFLNILGATTPGLLQSMLPKDAMEGGFLSRIILVYAEKKEKVVPLELMSPARIQLREHLINDLQDIYTMAGQFKVTSEFIDLYVPWYIEHSTEDVFDDKYLKPYIERRQTHLRKLAMVMSASRGTDMLLTEKDFHRALALMTETEKQMTNVFRGYGMSKTAEIMPALMAYIVKKKTTTRGELLGVFYRDVNDAELRDALVSLVAMQFCELKTGADGNQKVIYIGRHV